MIRFVFALVLAFAVSGCMTYYEHPTKKSTAAFERDKRDCERIAAPIAARKGTRPCDEIDRCLVNVKGWKRSQ